MTPQQIAEKVSVKLRIIGDRKYIDFFDKIDNDIIICTVTISPDMFKVACTVNDIDVSEDVKSELIKIINK
jgi:hypothetical protein